MHRNDLFNNESLRCIFNYKVSIKCTSHEMAYATLEVSLKNKKRGDCCERDD